MKIECYGCKHLFSSPDGAGGGLYLCNKYPGVVLGEWGHWTSEVDEPMGNTDCYEPSGTPIKKEAAP
jgi:hypothetical protein